MEKQSKLDLSDMPQVNGTFEKILELRKRHEEGKLPKNSDAFKSMAELAVKYGFRYEEHTVVTRDGYILTLGRIPGMLNEDQHPNSNNSDEKKPVILLAHGMGCNMMQWVFNTNSTAHAYVLARAGYDVWMTNNRGTVYSLGHVKLDAKKDREYWSFTWEQMGTEDLVAIMDHVLSATGKATLSYMGHS